MSTWFIIDDSVTPAIRKGPYGVDALRALAEVGVLRSETKVSREGLSTWSEAGLEPELAGFFSAVTSPPTNAAGSVQSALRAGALSTIPMPTQFSFGAACSLTVAILRARPIHLLVAGLIVFAAQTIVEFPEFVGDLSRPSDDLGQFRSFIRNFSPPPEVPWRFQGRPLRPPLTEPINPLDYFAGTCISKILQVVITLPMLAGACYAGAQVVRGESKKLDVLEPFKRYGDALLGSIVAFTFYVVFVALAAVPLLASIVIVDRHMRSVPGQGLVVGIGVLVSLIALVHFASRYITPMLFLPAVLTDPRLVRLDISAAMNVIWTQTRDTRSALFGFNILIALLSALTSLLFCIGLPLIGFPLLVAAFGASYSLYFRQSLNPITDDPDENSRLSSRFS